jgi:hypothetical protein
MDIEDVESTPRIEEFDIKEGLYHLVKVRFDDAKADDGLVATGDELLDNTMLIKGTFDYNGKSDRKFTFIFKFDEDVNFNKANGIRVREGEKNNIIIALLLDQWLKDVNITDCLDNNNIILDGNGDLLINENNGNGDCNACKETLKSNILSLYSLNSL